MIENEKKSTKFLKYVEHPNSKFLTQNKKKK